MQRLERVGNASRIRPEPGDDITIIHGMLRLDARGKPQFGQTRDIGGLEHLGVLDGAMRLGTFGAIQHNGVRLIADGMAGDVETVARRHEHVGFDLLGRIAHRAEGFRIDTRIRRGTVGGSGVQRTVGNELHRADVPQPVTPRQFVTRMPTVVDGLLQAFRIHAGPHAQTVDAPAESTDPRVDVLGHLVIAYADDALARGIEFGVAQQAIQLFGGSGRIIELAVGVEPFQLAHKPGLPHLYAEFACGGGIHPAAMHVGAGEHHGLVACDFVDGGERGLFVIGPQRMTEPHAHHITIGAEPPLGTQIVKMTPQHHHRLVRTAGADQIEPSQRVRPLREMRMAIPQAGNDPHAFGVEYRQITPVFRDFRRYAFEPPFADHHVHRLVGAE